MRSSCLTLPCSRSRLLSSHPLRRPCFSHSTRQRLSIHHVQRPGLCRVSKSKWDQLLDNVSEPEPASTYQPDDSNEDATSTSYSQQATVTTPVKQGWQANPDSRLPDPRWTDRSQSSPDWPGQSTSSPLASPSVTDAYRSAPSSGAAYEADSGYGNASYANSYSPSSSYGQPPGQQGDADWGEVEPPTDWGGTGWSYNRRNPEDAAGWNSSSAPQAWDEDTAPGGPSTGAAYGAGSGYAAGPNIFADSNQASSSGQNGSGFQYFPSDITMLTRVEMDGVLPLAPTPSQANFYQPKSLSERIVQLLGAFGLSVVLSKTALFAGPALLYPIWSPWLRAGWRNLELYTNNLKTVGLWRAQVLQVDIRGAPSSNLFNYQPAMVQLVVGDPWEGGARTRLDFPFEFRADGIQVGDGIELLVLAKDNSFTDFKVVREVYLPETAVWLAEYPFVNREFFLDISIQIENARLGAEAASPAAPVDPYRY